MLVFVSTPYKNLEFNKISHYYKKHYNGQEKHYFQIGYGGRIAPYFSQLKIELWSGLLPPICTHKKRMLHLRGIPSAG